MKECMQWILTTAALCAWIMFVFRAVDEHVNQFSTVTAAQMEIPLLVCILCLLVKDIVKEL